MIKTLCTKYACGLYLGLLHHLEKCICNSRMSEIWKNITAFLEKHCSSWTRVPFNTTWNLQEILKQIWRTSVSMSTSRHTTSSPRWSRTSCSTSTRPSLTWSTRRCTSYRPTASPARASSRRFMRSRMSMRTGKPRNLRKSFSASTCV